MKYKKTIETKLRHYATINQPLHCDSLPTSTTLSVTEKLAKLRTEQARAATNKRQNGLSRESSSDEQRQPIYHIHPRPGLPLSINEQQTDLQPPLPREEHALMSAPGPPPPPSWTRRRPINRPSTPNNHFSFQHYRMQQQEKIKRTTPSTMPSLVRICCRQLAIDTTTVYESSMWIDQIKKLPNHVKQRLLFEWSFYDIGDNGDRRLVTDATMDIFEKTEYEELWLEASQISLERLIRAFWKINKISMLDQEMNDEPVDDWEDLLLDDGDDHTTATTLENTTIIHNDPPTVILHLDYQEEIGKWEHLSHVVAVLQRRRQIESTATRPSYALSSPFLGRTLASLNISFIHLAPSSSAPLCWTTFAHLVVSTLPHLRWLYSAGCFDSSEGFEILTVLSHGLRKLKFWDLGYHAWLQLDILTSAIDWQRDLMELTTLCLSSYTSSSSDITQWFKDDQLARIKFVWTTM